MRIPKPTSDSRKVPWLVSALLVVLLILVPVLAWLQYQWTGEASRAEVFRMRSNLRTTLAHFSFDFDQIVNLQQFGGVPPELRQQLASDDEVKARATQLLLAWTAQDAFPGLLRGTWAVGEKRAWLSLDGGQTWSEPRDPASVPPTVYRSVVGLGRNPNRRVFFDLDAEVLLGQVVPALVDRYFSGPDGLPGYALVLRDPATGAVVWSSGNPSVSAPAEVTLNLLGDDRGGPVLVEGLVGTTAAGGGLISTGTVVVDGAAPNFVVRSFRIGSRPAWVLEARHVDGTLEAAAERVRWLNLGGTFTLLSLLTFGFLFVFRLYNRNRLAVRAQQDFVSSVSHELKSPLAVLRAAAENLKEGVVSEPDQAKRYGERMLSEADRLLVLTENILRYSRLEGTSWNLEGQEPLDLGALARARTEAARDNFAQRGVELATAGAEENLWVRGREADLAAVIDNLLSNALKHGTTGPAPRVVVEWGLHAERGGKPLAFVAIADNGKGLASREHKRVFEPFYRPSGTTVNGVGLGLSLVARLAGNHGGRVDLKSAPGAGARFTVLLPLSSPPGEGA